MDNDLVKKLETCIKWTDSDVSCTVKIIDLQRLIQEYKNQEFIIKEMAEQLAGIAIWDNKKDEPLILASKEEVIEYYEERCK